VNSLCQGHPYGIISILKRERLIGNKMINVYFFTAYLHLRHKILYALPFVREGWG
jgi:hypothetical protein